MVICLRYDLRDYRLLGSVSYGGDLLSGDSPREGGWSPADDDDGATLPQDPLLDADAAKEEHGVNGVADALRKDLVVQERL